MEKVIRGDAAAERLSSSLAHIFHDRQAAPSEDGVAHSTFVVRLKPLGPAMKSSLALRVKMVPSVVKWIAPDRSVKYRESINISELAHGSSTQSSPCDRHVVRADIRNKNGGWSARSASVVGKLNDSTPTSIPLSVAANVSPRALPLAQEKRDSSPGAVADRVLYANAFANFIASSFGLFK